MLMQWTSQLCPFNISNIFFWVQIHVESTGGGCVLLSCLEFRDIGYLRKKLAHHTHAMLQLTILQVSFFLSFFFWMQRSCYHQLHTLSNMINTKQPEISLNTQLTILKIATVEHGSHASYSGAHPRRHQPAALLLAPLLYCLMLLMSYSCLF